MHDKAVVRDRSTRSERWLRQSCPITRARLSAHRVTRAGSGMRVRCALFGMLLIGGSLPAHTATAAPDVGDPAPEFALAGSDGRTHRLTDYRGRYIVLAWFPKVFTDG